MPSKIVVSLSSKSKIFNPLEALASTPSFKSESAVQNMLVGICPKCGGTMTTATTANADNVFWCASCCVASPMPNN